MNLIEDYPRHMASLLKRMIALYGKHHAKTISEALPDSYIGQTFIPKGSVSDVDHLPSNGNTVGDLYHVTEDGAEYAWLPTEEFPNGHWEKLGNNRENGSGFVSILSVTDFGAMADGMADDSSAIQDAINEASAGGIVYFPVGIYLLENAVKFHSNMILFFAPGAKLLQGAPIDNLMRNDAALSDTGYTATENVRIIGGTFDGGSYTVNNTLLAFCHAKNIKVEGCIFVNGYGSWHDVEVNSSKDVEITGCHFNANRRSIESSTEIIQLDALTSRAVYPWVDEGAIDSTPCANVVIDSCEFICNKCSAIGHHNTVSVDGITIRKCKITGTGSIPAIKLPYCSGLVVSECFINGHAKAVSAAISSIGASIHDNIFVGSEAALFGVHLVGAKNVDVHDNDISNYKLGIHVTAAQGSTTDELSIIHDNALRGMTGFPGYPNNRAIYADNGVVYLNVVNGIFEIGAISLSPTIVMDMTSADIALALANDNTDYEYGELASLTITAIANPGAFSITFTSGSTATVLTVPAGLIMPDDFAVAANTRYEINVRNGFALVGSWAASA